MTLPPDPDLQRDRVGAVLRRVQHALVGHEQDADVLVEMEAQLEALSQRLEIGAARSRPKSSFGYESMVVAAGDRLVPGYSDRPFSGSSSPFSLEFEVDVVHGEARALAEARLEATTTTVFGPAHEGAPERAHGGFVAALLDDLTGFVLQIAATSAYTGELTVRFHAGAPLGVPLFGRAWLVGRERRKLFIDGELRTANELIATCTTTYIAVNQY
jgi:acyl-coenzyme A thioesterase PaaI-like protein